MSRRWRFVLGVPAAALLAGTALTAGAAPAVQTQECKGLQVCVRVAGPWVVIPGGTSVPRRSVQFLLRCPKNYTVGGLDAEVNDRAIQVTFEGKLGSPVNPGITTSRDAVFTGVYVGSTLRAAAFKPKIGCMPGSGGGGRIQTAVTYRAGQPVVQHMVTKHLRPGQSVFTASCARRERLVSGFVARAFGGQAPPKATTMSTLRAVLTFGTDHVTAVARVADTALGARPMVQVVAECTATR